MSLGRFAKSIKYAIRGVSRRMDSTRQRRKLELLLTAINETREDDFFKALKKLLMRLKSRKNFSFSKFADGELKIMRSEYLDITLKEHGEFKYNPQNKGDEFYRQKLIESFKFKNEDYFAGIGCPCCIGIENFEWMKNFSGQDEEHLTWANIFVNANYPYYLKYFVNEEFKHWKVVLVCNEKAKPGKLPFKTEKNFRVGVNAWKNDYALIERMKEWISREGIRGRLFLFCAGPLGNMLAHQLFKYNRENTYMDVGSTLDVYMGLGATRDYLRGGGDLKKVCKWS